MMRLSRPMLALAGALVALAVVVAGVVVAVTRQGSSMHITAYFVESNGIYPGNHVDILGLPVGSVSSVTPEPHRVKVVLSLPAGTKVPLNAQAYIVPPSVISDRYVGLSPAWTSGPTMPDGYVLPTERTHEPAEFDDLVGSLTRLFDALGPKQAGAKGAVGRLVHVLSANLAGNGAKLHETIEGLASATSALTGNRGAFADVVTSLDRLTKNLAARDALIGSFNSDLAAASSQLAGERHSITRVVDNLSAGLLSLARFVRTHRASLHGDVADLAATTTELLHHQRALIETLDNLPLATQNLSRVAYNGAVVVKHANLGQNEAYRALIDKVCSQLGPVCEVLADFGAAAFGSVAMPNSAPVATTHHDSGLAALFGVRR